MIRDYVSSELPWMTDGAGLPPHADEHLPELVRTCFPTLPLVYWHLGNRIVGFLSAS